MSVDGSISNEQINRYKNDNTNRTLRIKYFGGEGVGALYNLETGSPTVNVHLWEASVVDRNAALTRVSWEKTYPIYEFVVDPTKKEEVKEAYISYVRSRQPTMSEYEWIRMDDSRDVVRQYYPQTDRRDYHYVGEITQELRDVNNYPSPTSEQIAALNQSFYVEQVPLNIYYTEGEGRNVTKTLVRQVICTTWLIPHTVTSQERPGGNTGSSDDRRGGRG
ncbi:MAG: hypothetical protein LBG19_09680 [Prevotellaceae bacterium]|jgi:hypothetical protein|nr:hypothetical protein [Prevotellaceae bacterium]